MKIIVLFGILVILNYSADSSLLDPVIENVRHIKATHAPGNIEGMWKKKMLWKPRWVKEWKSSNVLKPIWRKFWGPVIIREWVPIPKPPPQWHAQPTPLDSTPVSPGSTFVDSPEPPLPGFGSQQAMIFPSTNHKEHKPKQTAFPNFSTQGGLVKSGNYQSPPLPITSGLNSQAESYSGHSSYASSIDNSAFDLNPPVEQYNPQQPGYGYKEHSANINQNSYNAASKPVGFSSHPHHHHHHHHHHHQHGKPLPYIDHAYNSDQTKFPPAWNAWNPVPPNPYIHSQSQQGSSPVSVLSPVKSSPPDADKQAFAQVSPSNFQSGDNNFIQQAPLLSEYHYTEVEPPNPTPLTILSHSPTTPVFQHAPASTSPPPPTPVLHSNLQPSPQRNPQSSVRHQPTLTPTYQKPQPTLTPTYQKPQPISQQRPPPTHDPKNGNPQNGPLHFHPRHSPTVSHKPLPPKPSKQTFSSSKIINTVNHPTPKPNFQKEHKIPLNKTVKPLQFELHKLPDFKALPSSFETFHFIEPFPSNQTFTRAALVGNVNKTESDRISIISPGKAPPYIAKLAEEIVQEHLKTVQKENASLLTTTTTEPTTLPAQETKVTVVFPTTSPFIKKTLKAYLAHESLAEKSTNVFIVTPVPSKEGEV